MKNLLDGLQADSVVLATSKPLKGFGAAPKSPHQRHFVLRQTPLPGRWERIRRFLSRPLVTRRLIQLGRRMNCGAVVGVYPDLLFLDASERAARALGVPFFPYLHDTVAEAAASSRFARWASGVQTRVFSSAERIFVATGGMAELYHKKYGLDPVPLVHIYPERIPDALPQDPAPPGSFLWAGNAYSINDKSLMRIYGAIQRLEGSRLTMATGQSLADIEKLGLDLKWIDKTYVPVGERPRYLELIREHSVLVLALNWPDETHVHEDELSTIFPTKTPEYLASGRPIIVHCPEHYHLARFIREHGCGEVVGERSVDAVERSLKTILGSAERRERLGRRALAAAELFTPAKVIPLFVKHLEDSLSNGA